ncbi:MAG: HAD family hydrolase [Acidobacteria bacterium]|nr:MAG: HAD family hydrolase [Acidobacteriota bacterium]
MSGRGRTSMTSAYRLVAFDVDGTLVHHPDGKTVWQVLNRRFLDGDAINGRRFEMFRAGRISYPQWVALDVGDWIARDVRRAQLEEVIRAELRAMPGAAETVAALRRHGVRVAVISGTIDLTLSTLLPDLEFDRVYTNRIWFDDQGRIAGWQATPYDVTGKPEALRALAREFGVPLERTVYVGDAWNDLGVLREAGLGIAFHPKGDDVRQAADAVIEDGPLTRVLDVIEGGHDA